eukprot:s109_g5.t1
MTKTWIRTGFILGFSVYTSFVEAQVEVTAPLRSGPLQWHLHWESILSLAETVLRERREAELLGQFSQLRKQIFHWSPQVWASTSMSELVLEMQNAEWPNSFSAGETGAATKKS